MFGAQTDIDDSYLQILGPIQHRIRWRCLTTLVTDPDYLKQSHRPNVEKQLRLNIAGTEPGG